MDTVAERPMTRSESLKAAWERFIQADRDLFEARQALIDAEKRVQCAYQAKEQIEQQWANFSQELARLMMIEAPPMVQAQIAQEQAAQLKQTIPGNGAYIGGAANPAPRPY